MVRAVKSNIPGWSRVSHHIYYSKMQYVDLQPCSIDSVAVPVWHSSNLILIYVRDKYKTRTNTSPFVNAYKTHEVSQIGSRFSHLQL